MEDYYYLEELPLALKYGMSPHQFWDEDSDLFYAYQEAYINRMHELSWANGLYTELALEIALSNAFKDKNSKSIEYPNEDVYNPLKNVKKFEKIDTRKNNNHMYTLKQRLEERRMKENG